MMRDRKIIDYKVVTAETASELNKVVGNEFSEGWEPLGGHQIAYGCYPSGECMWAEVSQTLVRYFED